MEKVDNTISKKGFIITYILVFGFVFLILLAGLLGFILSQLKQAEYELAMEQALYVAEAGLNRYRWYLVCLLYTSPSPRDQRGSRMPSSA